MKETKAQTCQSNILRLRGAGAILLSHGCKRKSCDRSLVEFRRKPKCCLCHDGTNIMKMPPSHHNSTYVCATVQHMDVHVGLYTMDQNVITLLKTQGGPIHVSPTRINITDHIKVLDQKHSLEMTVMLSGWSSTPVSARNVVAEGTGNL